MQKLSITTAGGAEILAEYKRGTLQKITLKTGKLTPEQWAHIGQILPPFFSEWEGFAQRWAGRVSYQEITPKPKAQKDTLYPQFLQAWQDFYLQYTGLPYRINATDGKCLKEIIRFFSLANQNDKQQALHTWQALLGVWHRLDAFHQKNTDLKYINANINKILQNAKTGNAKKGAYSNEFKAEILQALYAG